jgi:Reverse transcriptase (RNA-dependent DNA polymerase)
VDGRSQRGHYTKEQTASPTISTDALMLSLIIDAVEGRDVATADVVGAYLLADMDDFVSIKLTGDAVDIMCKANSKYESFVMVENGKRVLYLHLLKALYGCVKSALLWYELFTSTLQEMGFKLNPYDPCVANKMINGKQCTIGLYVDDNKISHVDSDVVTSIIKKIEEKFGKMTVTRGKVHTFIGMKTTLHKDKTVMIKMKEYVKEAIEDFGEDVSKHAATPARKDLFKIDEKSPKLD